MSTIILFTGPFPSLGAATGLSILGPDIDTGFCSTRGGRDWTWAGLPALVDWFVPVILSRTDESTNLEFKILNNCFV